MNNRTSRVTIAVLKRDFQIMVNIAGDYPWSHFSWLNERLGPRANHYGYVTEFTSIEQCYINADGVWDSYGYSLVFFKESVDLKTIIEFKLMFG